MTLADLERVAREIDRERDAWAARLVPAVESRVSDARAHADRAITRALKATRDGRPTARRANRSPSFQAALNRLDELLAWLAGPSAVSLDGKVRDAREALYRLAFRLHRGLVPEGLWVSPDPRPTRANLDAIRAAAVHGLDPRAELAGPVGYAGRSLAAAVARAGAADATRSDEADHLDAWETRAAAAIRRSLLVILSDSAELANNEARDDMIHPVFLEG